MTLPKAISMKTTVSITTTSTVSVATVLQLYSCVHDVPYSEASDQNRSLRVLINEKEAIEHTDDIVLGT